MLTVRRGNRHFQVRAAALIRSEGYVLLHRTQGDDFWTLPGGRVELGEDAATTVVRELREELGIRVRCTGPAYVTETFFTHNDEAQHEIGMILFSELTHDAPLMNKHVSHAGIELDRRHEFRWFHEDTLPELEIFPRFLRQMRLDAGGFPKHIVEREDT